MEQKKFKLDVFETLGHINEKNIEFLNKVSDEERKGFQPLVVMRWLSGTSSPLQVHLVNELVNPYVFSLSHDKDLLYKLMTVCSVKKQRYKWIKPTSKGSNFTHCIDVICSYYGYSKSQASQVFHLLSDDDVLCIAEHQGIQKDEISKIVLELKQR